MPGMTVAMPQAAVSTELGHVLVVDDHAVVRLGLAQAFKQLRAGLEVSEAGSLAEAEGVLCARPDVGLVLLDLHLPDVPASQPLSGLRGLRERYPLVAVAMLSADSDPALAAQALRDGAAGWLPKSADPRALLRGLGLVLDGGCLVPPFALHAPAPEPLSERQLDVLRALVRGFSNKEIARELGISEATVKAHLVGIFRVLRVRNRAQAVLAGQSRV